MQMNRKSDRIRKIPHAEIDLQRWDEVISKAVNRRVYAFSWYLDITSEGWDALVWGDYEFVMPLTRRKKWGIAYLVQPCESQQLGVFPAPPADVLKRFLEAIFRLYKYAAINLNSENPPDDFPEKMEVNPRQNFLLNLNQSYEKMSSDFSPYTHRHLRRVRQNGVVISVHPQPPDGGFKSAVQKNSFSSTESGQENGKEEISQIEKESGELIISENISVNDYIEFKKLNQTAEIYGNCLPVFKRIIEHSVAQQKAAVMGVYDRNGALCAAALFISDTNRIYYLGGVSSGEGKALSAMFLLLDHVIRKFAGQNVSLDFEGSMVPGIAGFFKGFGAQPETYYYIKYNRLPKPVRLIKK